jgi:hypothetical protein
MPSLSNDGVVAFVTWLPLRRARGKVEFDGLERVSSQTILDMLEVPQRSRTAGTYRRLAKPDGGARLDGFTRPRPDTRRLQGASSRVCQNGH